MTTKTAKDSIFSFDTIEELCDALFDESGEEKNAAVSYDDGTIRLTVVRIRDVDVQVYQVKDSPELYAAMDENYLAILENITSGSDFYDQWTALLNVLEPYKIVDEVLNP